jgi:hypothetical protein
VKKLMKLAARWNGRFRLLAWFGPGLVGGGDANAQRTLAGVDSLVIAIRRQPNLNDNLIN